MYVLVAKILAPVVVFCTAVVSEWSRLRDASTRRQAMRRVTMGAAVAVAVSAGLVVDHGNHTAAVATAQKDAAEEQAARQSIQESLDAQDADLSAARVELAETHESLSRLEGWAEEAVALMRERDPSLTQQEALARIVERTPGCSPGAGPGGPVERTRVCALVGTASRTATSSAIAVTARHVTTGGSVGVGWFMVVRLVRAAC